MQDFALCLSSSSASPRLVSHFLVLSWLSHLKLTYNHISHCPALRTRLPTAHSTRSPTSCFLFSLYSSSLLVLLQGGSAASATPIRPTSSLTKYFTSSSATSSFSPSSCSCTWPALFDCGRGTFACAIRLAQKKKELEIIKFLIAFIMRFALDSCRRARDTQPSSF